MKRRIFICGAVLLAAFTILLSVSAHPGRTDKYGGHTNKATGEYHYHNADGTTTPAPNPNSSGTSSQATQKEESSQSAVATEPENSTPTVVVETEEKPVQKEVVEEIEKEQEETPQKSSKETKEIQTVTAKSGDKYVYIPYEAAYSSLNLAAWILLSVLALLGLCMVSPIICKLLDKIQQKNSAYGLLLHIPYLIFWLPARVGILFYKLYNCLTQKDVDK